MISVEVIVMVVEIGEGMAEEEVDEVHNSLLPGSKKVETAKGIPAKRGASTSLHQPGRTSEPSAGIVESLRQELKNIQQEDMSVTDYTLRINDSCDSLGSINVAVDDDEMVHICLGSLTQKYGSF